MSDTPDTSSSTDTSSSNLTNAFYTCPVCGESVVTVEANTLSLLKNDIQGEEETQKVIIKIFHPGEEQEVTTMAYHPGRIASHEVIVKVFHPGEEQEVITMAYHPGRIASHLDQ